MKGNPALQTVLVFLLLGTISLPVGRVISHAKHPVTPSSSATASPVNQTTSLTGTLMIKTAPAPLRLEVTSGGKIVLSANEIKDPNLSKDLTLPSGGDLVLRADWQDDKPHALHAEFLSHGTNPPVTHDYWAGRTLEDVLSLP
jgi:hypothetical protein